MLPLFISKSGDFLLIPGEFHAHSLDNLFPLDIILYMKLLCALLLFNQFPKETNPVKIVVGAGIGLYQKFIAPAQGDVCNFSPSCSNFAKQAILKYGPFWGSLMMADRLMRCQPGAYQYFNTYYSGIKDQKIYDPVENNYIFGKIDKSNRTMLEK